jgi:alpha-tubulin suppressor-like RCC1 family protein
VSAGFQHSVGLLDDGRVVAWGSGYRGRLGDGGLQDHNTPTVVPIPTTAPLVAVSAGHDHSLALGADGLLWSWGFNRQGQLGDGTRTMATKPVRVHVPAGVHLRTIEAGGLHSLAITDLGRVLEWGASRIGEQQAIAVTEPREVPLPSDVEVVDVEAHSGSVAVTRDGRVFAWGGECFPQVARFDDCRPEPHEILVPAGARIVQASVGTLLTSTGEIYQQAFVPYKGGEWRRVALPAGASVRRFDLGLGYVLALTSDRRVLAWGMNYARQLGVASAEHDVGTPSYVDGLDNVLDIAGGGSFSLAIRMDPTAAVPRRYPTVPKVATPLG